MNKKTKSSPVLIYQKQKKTDRILAQISSRLPVSETDKAYLAGIFDGEGCVYTDIWRGVVPSARIAVGMTNPLAVQLFRDKYFGDKIFEDHGLRSKKTMYYYRLSGVKLVVFLSDILPYLLVKKPQAICALELESFKIEARTRRCGSMFTNRDVLKMVKLREEIKRLNDWRGKK